MDSTGALATPASASREKISGAPLLTGTLTGLDRQWNLRIDIDFVVEWLLTRVPQRFYFFSEVGDILEVPVHAGEPHVRDTVKCSQLLHDELSNQITRNLHAASGFKVALYTCNKGFNFLNRYGPFSTCGEGACPYFFTIEQFATPVMFDNQY